MSVFLKQFWEFLKVRKKWWLGPTEGLCTVTECSNGDGMAPRGAPQRGCRAQCHEDCGDEGRTQNRGDTVSGIMAE